MKYFSTNKIFLTYSFLLVLILLSGTLLAKKTGFSSATVAGAPTSICDGASVSLSLNVTTCVGANGGNTFYTADYQWEDSPNNSTWTEITGATAITYSASPSTDTYYRCVITITGANMGCGVAPGSSYNTAGVLITVTAIPAQPGSITGLASVAPSTSGLTYTISSVSGATTYNWTVSTGWTINSGDGTVSISVTSGAAGQDGNITVNAENSCGTSPNQTLAVTVLGSNCPTSSSIGPLPIQTHCVGDAATQLTVAVSTSGGSGVPTILYQWYYNTTNSNTVAGATSVGGATSQNYTPLTTASEVGSRWYFCVGYTIDNGCAQTNTDESLASNAVEITVNDIPATPGVISGNAIVNPNTGGYIYSIGAIAGASSYTWTIPAHPSWSITSGQGTISLTVTSGDLGQDGNIEVTANNACGSSLASVKFVTVAVAPDCPTSTSVAPNTVQTHCVGDAANQLTATISTSGGGGTPTLEYQWYYNTTNSNTVAGATSVGGAINQNYTPLTTASEVGSRWYFCVGYAADNGCGQTNTDQFLTSNAVEITVNNVPNQPGVITGSVSVNPSTGGLGYSILAVATATSYTWTVPEPTAWNIDAGGTTTSMTATSGLVGENGDITVTATNACGTSAAQTLAVTVSVAANPPTITLGSNPTVCTGNNANLTYSGTTESPDQYSIDYFAAANTAGFVDVVNAALPASPIILASSGIGTGTYSGNLTVRNSGTGLSSGNYIISVTIIETPAQPGAILGVSAANENSVYTYSIAAVTFATSYTWSVPSGWTIDAGQGTTSIDVTTGTNGDDGNITINATNTCGTSSSQTLAVTCITAMDHSAYNCSACHIFHNATGVTLTNAAGNALLCQSCHVSGGNASAKAIADADKAIPGTSGNSHAWGVSAINGTYETNVPSDSEMALRVDAGNIVCSTCHNQHNPNTYGKYLRISNTADAICKDCHSSRDIGRYADAPATNKGSHPVGLTWPPTDPSNYNVPPTGSVDVTNGIECSSCHQTHFAATSDGYLLRQTNDNNLCKECHTYGDHNGFSCKDCHQTHNPTKDNIYMIKDLVDGNTVRFYAGTGTNSFADGNTTYDGICEVCHTSTNHHTSTGDGHSHYDGQDCTGCHPHSSSFSPSGGACHDCHMTPVYEYPATGAHEVHVGRKNYDCGICHDGLDNNSPGHADGTPDIIFSGIALPFGADAGLTPTYNTGTKTCDNVYCHSDGMNADVGARDGEDWGGDASSSGTFASPVWTGSITTCDACHAGVGNMNSPYTITTPGTDPTLPPTTGSHQRGAHLSNSQELSGNGWTKVQCFYCHNVNNGDDGSPINQGTYGTSLHCDGVTYFDPKSVIDGGTMVNSDVGGSMSYSKLGSAGHCGAGKTCW